VAEAREFLGKNDVHVLLTDQRMPDVTGTAFLAELGDSRPEMVRILLTGYADVQAAIDAINTGHVYRYLNKPCAPEELVTVVRQAFQRHDLLHERNTLVAELQQANGELRELDRVRTAFLEVIGHELKTPITVLLGYTHLLSTSCYGELPAASRPPMENLTRTLGHLNDIVMRTLKLLKADLREGTMSWEEAPLADTIRRAESLVAGFLALRKQTLEISHAEPDLVARADRSKVIDILVNLLTNSMKHCKDGAAIKVETWPLDDLWVQVRVSDQGQGIEEEDLPRVFDRFFCSFDTDHHSSGTYQYGRRGVGLGLAIVKRFVELHGGKLDLQSTRGKGTQVSFTLPRALPSVGCRL
jgi:signal transduction histidine kinase